MTIPDRRMLILLISGVRLNIGLLLLSTGHILYAAVI